MSGQSVKRNLECLGDLNSTAKIHVENLSHFSMQDVDLSRTKEINCFLPRSHETSNLVMELLFTGWAVSFQKSHLALWSLLR